MAHAQPPSIWATDIPNQSPTLVIVCIVFLILTSLVICARFTWRSVHRQRGLDDVMALCAYVCLIGLSQDHVLLADKRRSSWLFRRSLGA